MAKIRKCACKGCELPVMKKPGNNTFYFKYCQKHQIEAVLRKQREEKQKDKAELENTRKKKKKTPQERFYDSQAWKWFSHYVLLYYADEDLEVRCCTSPHLKYHVTNKDIHCGHFHKADAHRSVCLDFVNCAPQSYYDNCHFGGKPEVMELWIKRTHGEKAYEELEQRKNKSIKFDEAYLDEMRIFWRKKYRELLIKRGVEDPWK